ncbi:MAG: methylmalonyl-CoA epimerase [Bacteroidota bacterium]
MKVSHIGIAVKSVKTSGALLERLLGQKPDHREQVADQGVQTVTFHLGETSIELLESSSPGSSIAKFIEKRGEGIHHLSFAVDNILRELARLKKDGFQLIDETPRPGVDNTLIAFVHPKSTNGVLIELSQKRG